VNSVGLTTSPIPYASGVFEVQFNFIQHQPADPDEPCRQQTLALKPRSVADFYREFMAALASLGVAVKIWRMPWKFRSDSFDQDTQHASYDAGVTLTGSGGFSFRVTRCSSSFGRHLSEGKSGAFFSGEASIWR